MFCQKCGKEIEDGTRFCEHCGAAQDAAAAGNPGTNSNAGVNPTMQASPYPAQAM
ncbi:MAG: zinc-ribbon domain-containing protein, partial [Ruminococcus sp.]